MSGATWRGQHLARELLGSRGVTHTHRRYMAELIVSKVDISGMGVLLAEYLHGERGSLGRDEITTSLRDLADWMGRLSGPGTGDTIENDVWALAMRWGLQWAGGVDPTRLGALTRGVPGPCSTPFELGSFVPVAIGEMAERELYGDGWWPLLASIDVSESGFDYLTGKVESGEMDRIDLLGVTSTTGRIEKVLIQCATSGETLEADFARYHCGWLRRDPGLLERVLTASGSEGEGLFGIGHDVEDWDWGWVRASWLEGFGEEARRDVAFQVNRVTAGASPWRCDEATMRQVLTHVRGAARAVVDGASIGGEFAHTVLEALLAELFGEDAEMARGLLNPAASLVELCDVVARLDEIGKDGGATNVREGSVRPD